MILEKMGYKIGTEDRYLAKFFDENGYCIIPKSDFVSKNIDEFRRIVDSLLQKESWRGGWEGKEEYLKYQKKFQLGANRLGNLFNKHNLFLKLLTEKNILKVVYAILGDDMKVGALDMREPKKGTGQQDLHIDWIPKKNENEKTQNIVVLIFLDDSNEKNGPVRLVPKTHTKTGWIEENLKNKSSHPDEIYLKVKKAAIVLMDANLWHSGTTNISGKKRRVLFLDIRRRKTPQLLNQRIYLDENTQKKLTDNQKFLLGLRDNDSVFEDKVFTAGNVYRKQFKTKNFVNMNK
tara:strand:+ start:509 stop:1381 length:873 start_codon:yes stop_codon:yes gene_type:complete